MLDKVSNYCRFKLKKKSISGFTLIELILIVVLILVLLSFSLPQFRTSALSRTVNVETRKLESFINYVTTKARTERREYDIKISSDENNYWYQYSKDNKVQTSRIYSLPDRINLVNKGDSSITIYPDGKTSGNLKIIIVDIGENFGYRFHKNEGMSRLRISDLAAE